MPELPDLEVFSTNLKSHFAGKKLVTLKVINGKSLKDKPSALSETLEGKMLKDIYRSGKELRFKFSNNTILGMHLMLTGDLFLFDKTNDHKSTIVEFYFTNDKGLALTDRMGKANVKLNPKEKKGIDAMDNGLNFKYLKTLFDSKATIKNLLLDQDHIRGIGNAYADEILWQVWISPFSKVNAIPEDKIKELVKAIKSVLKDAISKIRKKHPGIMQGEIRDFLKIHSKDKTKSPTGSPIKNVKKGRLKTYYTEEQKLYS
jgi:formamidopyrimidine-DNA glycosylase